MALIMSSTPPEAPSPTIAVRTRPQRSTFARRASICRSCCRSSRSSPGRTLCPSICNRHRVSNYSQRHDVPIPAGRGRWLRQLWNTGDMDLVRTALSGLLSPCHTKPEHGVRLHHDQGYAVSPSAMHRRPTLSTRACRSSLAASSPRASSAFSSASAAFRWASCCPNAAATLLVPASRSSSSICVAGFLQSCARLRVDNTMCSRVGAPGFVERTEPRQECGSQCLTAALTEGGDLLQALSCMLAIHVHDSGANFTEDALAHGGPVHKAPAPRQPSTLNAHCQSPGSPRRHMLLLRRC